MLELDKIYNTDALSGLKSMDDNSVDCCITSPPYYALRDYGDERQIGLEDSPEEYINRLVEVFREVKRVLKDSGPLWLNIGDSYAGSGKGAGRDPENAKLYKQGTNKGTLSKGTLIKNVQGLKPKDLIGIPWMLAFALRSEGYYLRNDIIWAKQNVMPESVKDRCTRSHEYIFLLSKSRTYYFDYKAIQEKSKWSGDSRIGYGRLHYRGKRSNNGMNSFVQITEMRNKRDVWNVNTQPFKGSHFATFPPNLIVPAIKAGCPIGGTVLDPFMGAGTTALVAKSLDRHFIGFEINPDYVKMAEDRLTDKLGLFK